MVNYDSVSFLLGKGVEADFGGTTENMIKQHLSPHYSMVSINSGVGMFVQMVMVY
jgi:hypothetical protein